ncbi:LysR family transcriptional regulator [Pseudovibrio japonicus]|uniref:LysR family transcriptional regulator n=1 Tax=Pseudovibrio japonicus TaxID=366534 RepID=UPI00167AFECD|nr:LysR family transcriptional regulator [Pseudovibrio japonicus]
MSNDKFRQMLIFSAVIDAGGFAAAAERLGTSQSAVSKGIRALEDRLGAPLLQRTTRGHYLSAEGEKYLEDCRRILELVDSAEDSIASRNIATSGRIKISAPVSFGLDQINPIIPAFIANNPKVEVELLLTDRQQNLLHENIDVAIRMGDMEDSTHIQRKLCNLDRLVVASPKYLQRCGAPETPDDLKLHNCLMWTGNAQHLNMWPFFEGETKVFARASGNFRSNNGMTLTTACLDGIGIMRIAEHFAIPLIESGKLVQLLADYHKPDNQAVHIVYLPEKRNLSRIKEFVNFCIERFREPNWMPTNDRSTMHKVQL